MYYLSVEVVHAKLTLPINCTSSVVPLLIWNMTISTYMTSIDAFDTNPYGVDIKLCTDKSRFKKNFGCSKNVS